MIIAHEKFKNINYCTVCHKHVYNVDNEYDMKQLLDNGSCVSLTGKLIDNPNAKNKQLGGCLVM